MKKTRPLLIITLVLQSLFSSSESKAFDLSLLQNDKELVSRSYTKADRILALKKTSASAPQTFALLGESINELEKSNSLCDAGLVKNFKEKLSTKGFSTDHNFIINLLISWRSKNLIDDVFFEIFEQAVMLDHELATTSTAQPSSGELAESEGLLSKLEITSDDLSPAYKSIGAFNRKNPACSANTWIQLNQQLSSLKGKDDKNLRTLNVIALHHQLISADTFDLLESYRLSEVQNWRITLQRYLDVLSEVKNNSRPSVLTAEDLKPNKLSSQFRDKETGITYRSSLYYRFNADQIKMIADLLKKTFERMNASKAEVVFTYPSGEIETLPPLSPTGQSTIAKKLLRVDMINLNQSIFFKDSGFDSEDILTAALETGYINSAQLDTALKMDDGWNPPVQKWAKLKNFAFGVSSTATLFIPPPYNLITSIALVFLNGQLSKKADKSNIKNNNPYDIF